MKLEEISYLIWFAPSKLTLFFENAVMENEAGLPNFAEINKGKNLIFECSSSTKLTQEDIDKMVSTKKPESELWPVQFKMLKMDLNLEPGSEESIHFHK
jgi:hypothetical protein